MKSRFIAGQLLVVLLLGAVLYFFLNRTLENYQATEVAGHLKTDAGLATLTAAREIRDLGRDAPPLAASIGRAIKARVTIITAQGVVAGDSEVPAQDLHLLDNHSGRPEVREALATGQGLAVRYSETLHTDMLYVAVPFQTTAGSRGVLRLALPLSSLDSAKRELHVVLGGSLALAALLLVLCSSLLARAGTRSLHAVAAIASRISQGELGTRVPVEDGSEVGELARVLNEMAFRTEQQLGRISAEKNRLDTILRGMGEGIMVADPQGVITLVNPAFKELFAITSEVQGQQLIDISRHPALHESFREVIAHRQERVEELQLRIPKEKTVLTHWVPLLENGVLQGAVAVFHDISDIRQLEKMRRDFVANVSHELRTPVTVIKGYAETLLSGALESNPEQAARFVGIIYSHADRLASLIGDLLTLSQLESGTITMETRSVTLPEVAGHVVSLLEQKILQRRITIDSSGLEGAPLVLADPGRLEQVFFNLLDNAIKYTPAGGSVAISARAEADRVLISVRDTGVGIPARDLPRIFERFYRVDSARSREEGGTGLGLAIVKHIVQLLGGTVSVESSGQGSVFYVTLRRAP
jgi:two-component system, OmpR family, phosphate regulon sensor histidine kinase PhoR